MDLELKDRVAIVTGSSRGIGRAIALALAEEGCHVALSARGEERLRETETEVRAKGVRALGLVVDLTKGEDIERLVAETAAAFGRIDVLVNSVGGSWAGDADEAWNATYEANILAAVGPRGRWCRTCGGPAAAASSTSPPSGAGRPAAPFPTTP